MAFIHLFGSPCSTHWSSKSFINTLRRFIWRRGQPEEMRSDKGGNFVRGKKKLRNAVNGWNQSQIHDYLLRCNVKWMFKPPVGSHHGGVWEWCICTVCKVLKALMTEQVLDNEGLTTLMCEVEAMVNGRPIPKVSDDPCDLEPLTNNHLLLLQAGPSVPLVPSLSKTRQFLERETGWKIHRELRMYT